MSAFADPMVTMIQEALAPATVATEVETAPVAPASPATPEVSTEAPAQAAAEPVPAEAQPQVEPEFTEAETPEQLLTGVLDPNSTRGQKIWHAYKMVTDLIKPETEGGIGHEPTVEDIRNYHGDHLTLTQMLDDFEAQPETFLSGMAKVNPEAAAAMIENLPTFLDRAAASDPHLAKAQEALYTQVNNATVDGLLDLAKSSTGDMQKFYFNLAKNLKYFVTGGKVTLQDTVLAEPLDPLANERKQLQAREERLNAEDRARAERQWNGFKQEVFTGLDNKLKDAFSWPEDLQQQYYFDDLVTQKMAAVRRAVGESTVARSELDSIMRRAQAQLRAGQNVSQTMLQFQNTYLKYARPHIVKIRAEVLSKAGVKPVATAVKPGQKTPAPAATTTLTPPSSVPAKKNPGEGFGDYAARVLSESLTGIQ